MKKILIIVLILTCLLGLVGCDPAVHYLSKGELLANTVKIELFDYENKKPILRDIDSWLKPKFDFNKATLIATLDEAYFENIITDITENEYLDFGTALNEPLGKTLVLYQTNGNMIVLFGCIYNKGNTTKYYGDCCIFDENGVFIEYIGDVSYVVLDELESTYFESNP